MREAVSSALQDSASSHSHAAAENGPATADCVTDEHGQDSSEKAAEVVCGDSDALVGATLRPAGAEVFVFRAHVCSDFREVLVEGWQLEETACDALVITEKPVAISQSHIGRHTKTDRKSRLPSELMARLRDLPLKPKYFFPNMATLDVQTTVNIEKELEEDFTEIWRPGAYIAQD